MPCVNDESGASLDLGGGANQNRNIFCSNTRASLSERISFDVFSSTYIGGLSTDLGSPCHKASTSPPNTIRVLSKPVLTTEHHWASLFTISFSRDSISDRVHSAHQVGRVESVSNLYPQKVPTCIRWFWVSWARERSLKV